MFVTEWGTRMTDGAELRESVPPRRTVAPAPETGPIMLRHRPLGDSDLRVFPVAMSGNVFGFTCDSAQSDGVLDTYAEFGGNFIDTADAYSAGRSETIIGEWMRRRGNRDDMVIATKVGKGAEHAGVDSHSITAAVHDSLDRLGTDHIDLLYLHVDDAAVPFEETLLTVDELVRAGKIRYAGASDHSANRLIEARVIAAQLGATPLLALQNQYSLVNRSAYEGSLARVVAQQGLAMMPRYSLAGGFLSGRYRTRADVARARRGGVAATHFTRRGLRVLVALDQIAQERHVAMATIALAWLLSKQHIVSAVAGASTPEQVLDLVAAATVQLTRHEVAELDRASA